MKINRELQVNKSLSGKKIIGIEMQKAHRGIRTVADILSDSMFFLNTYHFFLCDFVTLCYFPEVQVNKNVSYKRIIGIGMRKAHRGVRTVTDILSDSMLFLNIYHFFLCDFVTLCYFPSRISP